MEFTVRTVAQLGAVLRGFRDAQGLTQQALGERAGLAQKSISAMEHAPERSSVARLFQLLSGLEVELVLRRRGKTPSAPAEW